MHPQTTRPFPVQRPDPSRSRALALACACAVSLGAAAAAHAQSRAAIPAGVEQPVHASVPRMTTAQPEIPARTLRQAEDAYIRGARALEGKDLAAAEREFTAAAHLNPRDRDYALALVVTREHRLTDLVQRAAAAERKGHTAEADALLQRARAIDPENAVVRQHFEPDGQLSPFPSVEQPPLDPVQAMRATAAHGIGGPVELKPQTGRHSVHARGGEQQVLQAVCSAFGLKAQFDSSVVNTQNIRFDLDDATFSEARRLAESLTHTFAVPLQPTVALFAKDTPDKRAELQPLVEETLYIPGVTAESLTEYANLARTVFNLKTVTSVGPSGGLVLRGDQATLDRVNATFADLVDGGSDVLLDLTLYEVDKSLTRTVGAATPSSVGVFPVAAEAEALINQNQSLISAAIASNQLVLTSNPNTNAILELGLLLASGVVSSSQFTNLLGVLGHYGGLPLAGVFLGSTTTFNALLNTSDVRVLDTVQLRAGGGQDASFRAGTRYPIETGVYSSSGASSSLTAAAAGLSINGTSVSSLLSQYLGSTSVSVPQIQFEDLGLTLKATPNVLRSGAVTLKLDLKIEALGSGSVNTLPVLNSRALTSQVTIPVGGTALLGSLVTSSELRSIDGLPFLSEIPGFQGTEKSLNINKTELLITLTPHVVRNRRMEIASRRLLLPVEASPGSGGGGGFDQFTPPPGIHNLPGRLPQNLPSPGVAAQPNPR